ncbi:hypothetical protein DFJ58DRAFT_695676 [Suillus subalutaceus]|uniref:uncharacterized protein n=1 Tax=Suillus subalutaceus TaxID=48586 RepID=UPI001B87FCB7|nr:uncharacterized protein DFJ58DRAFT_695676 [Suillus subalutaceus]KAG1873524.1 hypothetical protein DFJ58DRAFT_695676 [Suillus subalutaceus]
MPPLPPIGIYPGNFSLNVFGLAGLFGADESISFIQTIHHYKARKFLGWYNSPGSLNVGKKCGKLAKSRFWDWLFPGPDEEPTKFFELDGKQGPKYVASRSGYVLGYTGHFAYFIMQKSKEELGYQLKGRVTKRNKVTIIKTQPQLVREIPPRIGRHTLVAILPIGVSFITCALCGWAHDWFCFSMILLGIVLNGIFSVVIGSARLKLQGVNSAPTAPPGDGMLMDGDDIVLLIGKERDVATITRGKFILEYDPWPVEYEYAAIGFCSLLFIIQFLCQLLLIPQGTLFGQIMFLSSLVASWAYNSYLSLIDNEYIQQQLILEGLHLEEHHMMTYSLGTRTTAAVFACLVLQPPVICAESEWVDLDFELESVIRAFIPNDTQVWVTWRKKISEAMRQRNSNQDACHGLLKMSSEEESYFEAGERKLLKNLLEDAKTAYDLAMEVQKWLKEK